MENICQGDRSVTIIIPVWNRESSILRSLASVEQQTYRPLEIVIVDDGSTDNTPKIISNWQNHLCDDLLTVKVISQKNLGASAARNAGLRVATGTYIQFLDSDDFYSPERTSQLVEVLEENPDLDYVWSEAIFLNDPAPSRRLETRVFSGRALRHVPMQITRGLFRRELCEATGPWSESLRREEDWVYKVRAMVHCRGAAFIPSVTYFRTTDAENRISNTDPLLYAQQLKKACQVLRETDDSRNFLVGYALSQVFASCAILLISQNQSSDARNAAVEALRHARGLTQRVKSFLLVLSVYSAPRFAVRLGIRLRRRVDL